MKTAPTHQHFYVLFCFVLFCFVLFIKQITTMDEKILAILTYVGLTLSIVGIILTIISYLLVT